MARKENVNEAVYEKMLDCTSCQNFRIEKDRCICVKGLNDDGDEYTGYKPCYAPSVFFLKPAIHELLGIRVHNDNAQASIGAAILLDLYKGASSDMVQQKYADTYGHVGHEQSGYSKPCRAALNAMVFSESTMMLRKWFDNFQAQMHSLSTRNASETQAMKSRRRAEVIDTGQRVFTIGDTEYFVLEQQHLSEGPLVTPLYPETRTKWGLKGNRWDTSLVRKHLDVYVGTHDFLKPYIASYPRLMSVDEYKRFKTILPSWDVPFWLGEVLDGTTVFAMAAMDGEVQPLCCYSDNVYFRPVFRIKK
ncbi:MAG: hypothetical protein LUE14_04065 [Clostridiales bacterium]|nr:hypothetical protein [Clostridiales bacterium]